MYKVFINDSPLFINTHGEVKAQSNSELYLIDDSEISPEKLWERSIRHPAQKLVWNPALLGADVWSKFSAQFRYISAAGGVLLRDDGCFLGIYRLNRWDLPKGKVEPGETLALAAVREVEEECGVSGVKINRPIGDTWHIYPLKSGFALKQTHWFEMAWSGEGELKPQIEEGIVSLQWFNTDEIPVFCQKTYASVADLLQRWQNLDR